MRSENDVGPNGAIKDDLAILINDEGPSIDLTIERLEDQIAWYDKKSRYNQKLYKAIKLVEIITAALIPLIAALKLVNSLYITAGLGVLITVLEGLLHLNQYQLNWTTYRSTCEALKHEKYVYLAHASPYGSGGGPHALLAERIESLVSQEHAKWTAAQQQDVRK